MIFDYFHEEKDAKGVRQGGNLQRRCRRHQPKEKPLQEQMPRHQTRAASKNMMPKPSDKDNKQEKMMPAASDKGSQPYSRAYGYGEMAGAKIAPNNISLPLGRRHEQALSLT
jgi:hypothetical protein